jgi:uncharacterized protein involved in exopolysaccharide biosynthesis
MKSTGSILWLFNFRFIIKAASGTVLTLLAVYFVTSPAIIKPLYESEVIVYVPLAILSQQLNQQGIGFGSEKEIDLYIQILKSSIMTDSLNKRFELIPKYGIKDNTLYAESRLYQIVKSRIIIEKTRYGSVSVRVFDHDPVLAAEMANTMISLGEKIKKNIFDPNRIEAMKHAQNLYEQKETELANLREKIDKLNQNDIIYERTVHLYNLEMPELIARKSIYERKKKELETPLPNAYIISSAVPASGPKVPNRRMLALLGAGLYLFLLLVIEIIRHDFRIEAQER